MILCPNCLHKEMVGALFCSECGMQLIYEKGPTTEIIQNSSFIKAEILEREGAMKVPPPPPSAGSDSMVSLNMISTGDIVPVTGYSEVTLGRVSEGQPIIPDIDLSPYKAYESGVSRMHASLQLDENQITVTDLGSANGTRINGMKITSQIPYPVKHGDILTLGKFKIQILLRNR